MPLGSGGVKVPVFGAGACGGAAAAAVGSSHGDRGILVRLVAVGIHIEEIISGGQFGDGDGVGVAEQVIAHQRRRIRVSKGGIVP